MMQPVEKIGIAAILGLQAALGLYLGLPGQMSTDSVIQLYEGRTFHFISFNPPLMSLLLGALDRTGNAPVAFVVISQAMLSASTWLVFMQSGRATALRFCLAAVVLLNPVVLIYVGIVWKDVLLAHAVVLVYLLIAWVHERRNPVTPWLAVLVLVLLTVIVGVRQQGLLFAVPAAFWAATIVRPSKRARLLAGMAFLAVPVAANQALTAYVSDARANPQLDPVSTGWRILVQYDIAGTLANGGALPAGASPGLAEELRRQSLRYSPYRVDTLTTDGPEFWALDSAAASRFWRATIATSPDAYLRHRATHFAKLLGLGDMQQCIPVYAGVEGPVVSPYVDGDLSARLGLSVGPSHAGAMVGEFAQEQAAAPLFTHLAYAAVLLPIGAWLARRREYVLVTLALCALLFLGSYSVLGVACDFRYAYTLTVATTLLAAYACLNWGISRGRDVRRGTSAPLAGSRKLRT